MGKETDDCILHMSPLTHRSLHIGASVLLLLGALEITGFSAEPALTAGNTSVSQEQIRTLLQRMEGYPEAFPYPVHVQPETFSATEKQQATFLSSFSTISFLLRTGQRAEAVQVLSKLPADRTTWPYRLRLIEIQVLRESNKPKDAIEACEALIKAVPTEADAYLILAEQYGQSGDSARGIETLERARKIAPRQWIVLQTLHQQYGRQYRDAKNEADRNKILDKLEDVTQAIIEARPGVPAAPFCKILAFIKMEKGKPEEAIPYLENLLLTQPKEMENYIQLAKIYQDANNRPKVLEVLRQATVTAPEDASVRKELSRILVKDGKPEEILNFYKSLAEEYPGRTDLQTRYAAILISTGKTDEAIRVVRALLEYDAHNTEGWLFLARLESDRGNKEELTKALDNFVHYSDNSSAGLLQAIGMSLTLDIPDETKKLIAQLRAVDPENKDIPELEMQTLVQSGKLEEALAVLKSAIGKTPENATLYSALVSVLMQMDRLEEAAPTLESGLKKVTPKEQAVLRELLVQVLIETKNYPKAIEATNTAIKADAKNWKMKTTLIRIYQKSGDAAKIDPAVEALLNEYATNADALYELGLIRWDQKRLDDTENLFRRALTITPDFAEAANSLGYLFAEQNKNIDEALTLIQKALTLKPNAPHIVDSLGWVYYQKADYQKALALFESVVQKMINDPVIYDHIADTYQKLNRTDDARKNYEQALAKSKDKELSDKVKEKLNALKK
ncbi:TPA: hypothetical protein DDW35_03680 [Candidatus Sumerlaeota bacterium]|jgi:predicted Zn-dependent protease|nr:hypothetical protein [Candidatus Sumerlaeota bacterium]